jgi:Phage tail lysozyme
VTNTAAYEQNLYQQLLAAGYTNVQAAGIIGNLYQESSLNPGSVGDSGQAYGIAQWHPDRLANCGIANGKPQDGASPCNTGSPDAQFDAQVQLLLWELNNTESSAGKAVKHASTIDQAVLAFQNGFERCGICNFPSRLAHAKTVFDDAFSGNWQAATGHVAGGPDIPGALGSAVSGPLDALGSVATAVTDIASGVTKLKDTLTSRKFWTRVGEFVLGWFILGIGVFFIFSESKTVERAEQAAPAAAALAA